MKKHFLLLLISPFFFAGWHCGPPDDLYDPKEDSETFGDFSFESNGSPDMQGWQYIDPSSANYVSFSKDGSSSYSQYSLHLQRDTVNNIIPGIRRTVINSHPYPTKKYVLSCESKGRGRLSVLLKSLNESQYVVIELNSAGWQRTTTTTFNCSNNSDSLTLQVQPLGDGPVSYLLIDNIHLAAQKR
ncbi:MAG: hypothetical protein ACOYNS_07970 [Bacteroidota bacterium]